jgi:trehalose-6-phosphatase
VSGRRSMAEHAAQLARRAGEVAVCLDFDGTIAPIVEDPAAAQPLAGTIELPLRSLGCWPAIVASCSAARPSTFESCLASPTPMLSVTFSTRGACIGVE